MNTYTPPSHKVLHYTMVDFVNSKSIVLPVHIVQYDDSLPILVVSLFNAGSTYRIPDNAEVNIRMGKYDNTIVYNPALGCDADRHIVYFEVTQQMTAVEGFYEPIVEIELDGSIAGSSYFGMLISRNPVQNRMIESTNEFKTGQQYALEAIEAAAKALASQNAAKISETNAAASETAALNSEEQAKAAYQEVMNADIGELEASLFNYHAVYQSIQDSSGDNLLDSVGNNIMSQVIFGDAADVLNMKKSISALESVNKKMESYRLPFRMTEVEEGVEELSGSLFANHAVYQPVYDSSGSELLDHTGNVILSKVVFADASDIIGLQKTISALENMIKNMMLYLIPSRLAEIEAHALLDNLY